MRQEIHVLPNHRRIGRSSRNPGANYCRIHQKVNLTYFAEEKLFSLILNLHI